MKYLALSLLLAPALALALHGAPQAGQAPFGTTSQSSILNFGALESGLFDVQAAFSHELVWTVPANRDFILKRAWMSRYGYGDTTAYVQSAATGRLAIVAWDNYYRTVDWEGEFRLHGGDQLWIEASNAFPNFGWSGFYVQP